MATEIKVEFYKLRLNDEELQIVDTFVQGLKSRFHTITFHKLSNGEVEVYTYREGVNRFSYDTFKKFKNKDFLLGVLQGTNTPEDLI